MVNGKWKIENEKRADIGHGVSHFPSTFHLPFSIFHFPFILPPMFSPPSRTRAKRAGVLLFLFLVLASFLTYAHNSPTPPSLFWDETTHTASAQKALNAIPSLDPPPPLAKMLIAAGEA